jgi:DNA-binding NarL/FixJ family response regulator
MSKTTKELRVMLVDDDEFSLTILGESMQQWASVLGVSTVSDAVTKIEAFDPHAVITDLNFNGGPDGGELLRHLEAEYPWIGRVVLTSHSSPTLALNRGSAIPTDTVYLVKADVAGGAALKLAVEESIRGLSQAVQTKKVEAEQRIQISKSQAEVLKLIAAGKSNAAIATTLGITIRAAEGLVQRTFAALQLKPDEENNVRVLATRMWIEGKVTSR